MTTGDKSRPVLDRIGRSMRISAYPLDWFEKRKNWHRFFSILPRKIGGRWMFLKTIERRITPFYFWKDVVDVKIEYRLYNKLRTLMGG